MNDFFNFITNQGFAIAVSVFLLVRFEQKINLLTESIHELSENLIKAGHITQ